MKFQYVIVFSIGFLSCEPERPPKDAGLVQMQEPAAGTSEPESKTEAEVIKEAVEEGIEMGRDLIQQFKKKDSIRDAERERIYGYRIGFPIKDIDEVFEIYKQFDNTEHIYVLKQSRKEYYLFYNNGGTEKQLNDSLESFRARLPESVRGNVIVMNMMKLCTNSKEKIMIGDNLTKRKEDIEIPCLICDK